MNELRPTHLKDIIGQEQIKKNLGILIKSAQLRNDSLPHLLFNGPPGLGKTTLSLAIAEEVGDIQIANGANLRTIKCLLPYLARITEFSILFIDEIHRCRPIVEEILYPVMEDFRCDVPTKDEDISFDVPKFTLIGATTESGGLSKPLYDRFSHKFELQLYSDKELVQLTKINSSKLNVQIDDEACLILVGVCRGVPRIVNHLLEWVRDISLVKGYTYISKEIVKGAIKDLAISEDGLTVNDRYYLSLLSKSIPTGLDTIAASTNLSKNTIESIIEPYLLTKGLIKKTGKGRILC